MNNKYLNIYNNLIKLTRNKNLYLNLGREDTFSDRLILLFFHFGFFLKAYKSQISKKHSQEIFDFVIRQIELSIREIGYGDVSVNKKMKEFVNLFYSIVDKIDSWNSIKKDDKIQIIENFFNIDKKTDFYVNYFDKYSFFLSNNTLNNFSKELITLKF